MLLSTWMFQNWVARGQRSLHDQGKQLGEQVVGDRHLMGGVYPLILAEERPEIHAMLFYIPLVWPYMETNWTPPFQPWMKQLMEITMTGKWDHGGSSGAGGRKILGQSATYQCLHKPGVFW